MANEIDGMFDKCEWAATKCTALHAHSCIHGYCASSCAEELSYVDVQPKLHLRNEII